MEDRNPITWKQFQKQTKNGIADDTKNQYKLGLREYNTSGHCKNKKSKVEKKVKYDNPLGDDDNASGLLKTLLKERNVAISDKRYKQCIEKYGNVLNFLGELGRRCVGMFGIRYAEAREDITEDLTGSIDSVLLIRPKNKKKSSDKDGFWVIEEID